MGFLGGLDGALPGAAVVVAVAGAGGVGGADPGCPENYRGRHSAGDDLRSIADLHLCCLLCQNRNDAVARTCLPTAHEAAMKATPDHQLWGACWTRREDRVRVLVAEDEPKMAGLLRRCLAAEGYAVDVATDAVTGLDAASGREYNATVLD